MMFPERAHYIAPSHLQNPIVLWRVLAGMATRYGLLSTYRACKDGIRPKSARAPKLNAWHLQHSQLMCRQIWMMVMMSQSGPVCNTPSLSSMLLYVHRDHKDFQGGCNTPDFQHSDNTIICFPSPMNKLCSLAEYFAKKQTRVSCFFLNEVTNGKWWLAALCSKSITLLNQ